MDQSFLKNGRFGVLGYCYDGRSFQNANNYYYDIDKNVLYFHRSVEGFTTEVLGEKSAVSYLVLEMGEVREGKTPQDITVSYESVMVYGECEPIAENEEKLWALKKLWLKYATMAGSGAKDVEISDATLTHTAVYRIRIDHLQAKADLPK
ncbi:MAG: pyridoxamine 5'-phosphate oxidase family protein [Anaerolineales bacterium]|nr:pyridoxamine 5'-phosphate oxidase family protein [Anaerolineales bacterium]